MRGWDCAQGSGLWRKLPEVEVIGERDHVQLCDVVVAVVGRQPATAWLSAVGWLCAADGREGAAGEPHLHPPRVHSCRLGGVVSTMIRTTRGAISGLSQCSVARVLNRGRQGRRIAGVESRRGRGGRCLQRARAHKPYGSSRVHYLVQVAVATHSSRPLG